MVRERFGSVAEVATAKRPFTFDVPFGPVETEAYFRRHIGPLQIAFSRLDAASQSTLAQELLAHWQNHHRGDDHHTLVETDYLEVHARPNRPR